MLILVLGGARSGKSDLAEILARRSGRPVTYVATSPVTDDEMKERIAEHRRRRPRGWETVEEGFAVAGVLARRPGRTMVVDCLGLFITNLMFERNDAPDDARLCRRKVLRRVTTLARAARAHDGTVIVVSNEVGQGIVPAYPAGRLFRDLLGLANQIMARSAEHVFYTVAGIPLDLKALQGRFGVPGGGGPPGPAGFPEGEA